MSSGNEDDSIVQAGQAYMSTPRRQRKTSTPKRSPVVIAGGNSKVYLPTAAQPTIVSDRVKRKRDGEEEADVSDEADAVGGRKAHKKMSQSGAYYMSKFSELQDEIQDIILHMEYDDSVHLICPCGRNELRSYRCCDCSNRVTSCKLCIVERHAYDQFHWVEEWNGSRFEKRDLSHLGLTINLGHDGERCPVGTEKMMTVVDINGAHKSRVVICKCDNAVAKPLQLIGQRIFPSTTQAPRTGFTFRCLKDFHLHTRTSKKSIFDYAKALDRMTNDPSREPITMPKDAFTRVVHVWRFLAANRESGKLLGVDSHGSFRPKNSVAEVCLACPIPDFNTPDETDEDKTQIDDSCVHLDEKIEKDKLPQEAPTAEHLDTLYLAIDGNMKLFGFAKNSNTEDKALWNGTGYFRREDFVLDHIKKHKGLPIKYGDCREFKATELYSKRYKNQSSTGVMSVLCRHDIVRPDSVVNLQKGERFVNADLALKGALQGTDNVKRRVCAYDIACQFVANIRERWSKEFPDYDIDNLIFLIGKMHITNHVELCQWLFSFYYQYGVGRNDGEGCERFWSEVNHAAGSLKQMAHGHRMDTLDDLIDDWNKVKLLKLATTIASNLKKARSHLGELRTSLKESEAAMRERHGNTVVDEWKDTPLNPVKVSKGKVETPFRSKTSESTLESILRKVVLEEMKPEGPTANGKLDMLLRAAVLIQQRQRSLRQSLASNEDEIVSDASVEKQCLSQDIAYWQQQYLQNVSLPGLREIFADGAVNDEVEDRTLYLPSDFTVEERQSYGLIDVAKSERLVREQEALLAIRNLKNACRQVSFFEEKARSYTRTTSKSTRSNSVLHKARAHKTFWISEYRLVRKTLIKLGMSTKDETYRPLSDKDLLRPSTTVASHLGKGGDEPGWVWTIATGQSEEEEEDWIREDDRVQWFKHLAATLRWKEEVELLEEEMRRLICGLDGMHSVWKAVQFEEELGGVTGRSAFAARKVDCYSAMVDQARAYFLQLQIPLGRFTERQIYGEERTVST